MRRKACILLAALLLCVLAGCGSSRDTAADRVSEPESEAGKETAMRLKIGETEVPVTWEDNSSVSALREQLPLTVELSMYGGFEQVGSLGRSIPRDDVQMTTLSGDVVLYAGNQIVVFYGSNSWAYTKLGHVDLSAQEMKDLLGQGNVSITLY